MTRRLWGQSRIERTYHKERIKALSDVFRLYETHGSSCTCNACEYAMERLAGLEASEPCVFCHGEGCGRCNHTGWRRAQ